MVYLNTDTIYPLQEKLKEKAKNIKVHKSHQIVKVNNDLDCDSSSFLALIKSLFSSNPFDLITSSLCNAAGG